MHKYLRRTLYPVLALALLALVVAPAVAQTTAIQTPEQFFGFKIGTDGELARYPTAPMPSGSTASSR